MLRCRQQRLLRRAGTERSSVQAFTCTATTTKTRHRLHELCVCGDVRAARDAGRRTGREATKLSLYTNRTQRRGTGDLIVGDVVDLQPAGIDVSQDHVAFAGAAAEIANSGELPIQADRA